VIFDRRAGQRDPRPCFQPLRRFGLMGMRVFMSENRSKFVAKIADNTINFGIFTFRLRPDGKMEGTRNYSGVLNTTVLIRDQPPVGP